MEWSRSRVVQILGWQNKAAKLLKKHFFPSFCCVGKNRAAVKAEHGFTRTCDVERECATTFPFSQIKTEEEQRKGAFPRNWEINLKNGATPKGCPIQSQ